jgi:hypothetical protein
VILIRLTLVARKREEPLGCQGTAMDRAGQSAAGNIICFKQVTYETAGVIARRKTESTGKRKTLFSVAYLR